MNCLENSKIDLTNKTVTIIGAAKSGLSAAKLIHHLKGKPKISDCGTGETLPKDFKQWALANQVELEFNGHGQDFVAKSDLVVLSPGVRFDAQPVVWAREKNIPVMGEIELAYRFCPCPIVAVTGSNGKTTTVTLISEILKEAKRNVYLCGNIGTPFAEVVLNLKSTDYVVLEVSSFQMESIIQFKPHVAVLLNFSQNHLDRHKDMQEYFDAKRRIFMNQDAGDFAVLNFKDELVAGLADKVKSKVVYFNEGKAGRWLNPNYMAAQAVGRILGIDEMVSDWVFANFKGVEHRLELVRTINGVEFINDSKSTTVEAGRWALENITKPIVIICGGRDKHADFTVLRDLVKKKIKKMITIGEARPVLAAVFKNSASTEECDSLEEAVRCAQKAAAPGDAVILSPMCASFDMFNNYEHRGQVFKEIVNRL